MTPEQFWQNFKLGEEQEIACNFIYDGLRNLHTMETLNLETEIFPILYNLSIGLERLFKVAIVLLEVDDSTDIDAFEKTLFTHNHIDLLERVKTKYSLSLAPTHTGLLNLLAVFYKDHRYGRFNLPKVGNLSKDKKLFLTFLHKHLGIEIRDDIIGTENTPQIKKFIGKTVKKITRDLYTIIDEAATKKNLYTYEISSSSKAVKVLLGDDPIIFEDEDISIIEAIIFLMKTEESPLVDFMKTVEPLPLDPALSSEYLQAILYRRPGEVQNIVDEVDSCYEEMNDPKERIEMIKVIKSPGVEITKKRKKTL